MLRHSFPHFPLILSIYRHFVLSGRTQLLSWYQSEKNIILINNNSFPQVEFEPTTVGLQSHPCAPARRPQSTTYLEIESTLFLFQQIFILNSMESKLNITLYNGKNLKKCHLFLLNNLSKVK